MQEDNIRIIKISKTKLWPQTKSFKITLHGGIQPLLIHGAPVWAETVEKASHRKKLNNVQRLIKIKIAKTYKTVSIEALCIITALTTIHIKIKKMAELYKIERGNKHTKLKIDHDKPPNNGFIQKTGP